MSGSRLATVALGAWLTCTFAPAPAHADDVQDERIARLERLILEQARQIEALRKEVRASLPQPAPARGQPPIAAAPRVVPAVTPGLPDAGDWTTPPPPEVRRRSGLRPAAPTEPFRPAPPPPGPATITAPAPQGAAPVFQRGGLQQRLSGSRGVAGGFRWSGYGTLEYIDNTEKNSFFDLHRLILFFNAPITDCMDVTGEIEIEHGGIGGGSRDGDVKFEHLTVQWSLSDLFNVKLGAPLVPFGRYNLNHDDPLNDFTKRPWVARYFVPTGFGQPGVGIAGSAPVGSGLISYDALLSTGFDDGFSASGGVRGARQSWRSDNNDSKQVWGRVSYAQFGGLLDYLEIGGSLTGGTYDDRDRNDVWGYAADWLLRKGPFELQGEYIRYDIDRNPLDPAGAVRGQDGLWLQLAYHFFPCAWRGCNACVVTPTSHFTLAVRYQTMDLDDNLTGAHFNDDLEAWSVGLNYRLTESTVFRIDHTWLDAVNDPDQREWALSFSTFF